MPLEVGKWTCHLYRRSSYPVCKNVVLSCYYLNSDCEFDTLLYFSTQFKTRHRTFRYNSIKVSILGLKFILILNTSMRYRIIAITS